MTRAEVMAACNKQRLKLARGMGTDTDFPSGVTGNWPEECEAVRRAADGAALQGGFPSTFSSVGLSEQPASPERQRAVRAPQIPAASAEL